jgi:hypothetical protein
MTIDKMRAAVELRDLMSEISERCYCAGWLIGTETALWRVIRGGNPEWGMGGISPDEVVAMKRLSQACDGWIYFDNTNGQTFIPLGEWEEMVKRIA